MERSFFMETPRLRFSKWKLEDEALAFQLWGDADVTRYISKSGYSDQQVRDRLQKEISNEAQFGVQYWPFFEKGSDSFIGVCGIRPYKLGDRVYELGFHLCPPFWGKGLAHEAAVAALTFAKEHVAPVQIVAGHHPENHASKKLILKLGFRYSEPEFFEPSGLMHLLYVLY
jgi:RimJ/RimL family protein N-acetyltransferase